MVNTQQTIITPVVPCTLNRTIGVNAVDATNTGFNGCKIVGAIRISSHGLRHGNAFRIREGSFSRLCEQTIRRNIFFINVVSPNGIFRHIDEA